MGVYDQSVITRVDSPAEGIRALGQIVSETDDTVDRRFGFTGRERDEESDLQYNRARCESLVATLRRWRDKRSDALCFSCSLWLGPKNLHFSRRTWGVLDLSSSWWLAGCSLFSPNGSKWKTIH